MIRFENVTVTYTGQDVPALRDVNLHIPEGELALLVGRTGSGKSTLLESVNGLVPHFTGGLLQGRVTVAGRDTRTNPPRELADVVGFVPQDPMSGFVTDTVEEELAYGMEALGVPPQTMRRRVEEVLDLLGLASIRDRALLSLSGGQRQRTAIGSVLTTNPAVLILDEPTSALDPGAAEEVLAAIQRLVLDLGLTVMLAEHRLERVIQYADSVVLVDDDGLVTSGNPAEIMIKSPVRPPVVELGRRMNWQPLPLSVRDARRRAAPWRPRLAALPAADIDAANAVATAAASSGRADELAVEHGDQSGVTSGPMPGSDPVVAVDDLLLCFGSLVALARLSLRVRPGEVVALMGRNGAGKSTLLNALVGSIKPDSGTVAVGADLANPVGLSGRNLLTRVGLVPQEAGDMLYADSVADECRQSDEDCGAQPGTTAALLDRIAPGVDRQTHPRDLSEGQRLALVLAIVLAARPAVVLLDEPTRGLDYPGKASFCAALRDLAAAGHAVLMATHDVELVADVATRVVIIADGETVADGPTAAVVVSSPIFAPQVSKVLRPAPILTVGQAVVALHEVGAP